ncbi:MAG TPA: signal peptidase I [Candidatus Acidoferrales bacterium]|nr:signal peptidase I [Candidatus Acidoferrales bacterium]
MKAESSKKAPRQSDGSASAQGKIRRELISWFWIALAFLLINGTVGQARVIPSASMQNTLLVGDHLIMSRVGYDAGVPFTNLHVPLWRNPKRQQIVIYRPVVPGEDSDIIKRVIGLPGETVDIHDGGVYINGARLSEPYAVGATQPYSMRVPFKVPAGCYFVMGDNREDSYDSRFTGCIPRQHIIGEPVIVYMSLDAPSQDWESFGIAGRLKAYGNAVLHPGTIRWRRVFHIF